MYLYKKDNEAGWDMRHPGPARRCGHVGPGPFPCCGRMIPQRKMAFFRSYSSVK